MDLTLMRVAQISSESCSQAQSVVWFEQSSGLPINNNVFKSAGFGGDNGATAHHGFDCYDPKLFAVRWHHRYGDPAIDLRQCQVLYPTPKLESAVEAQIT